MSEQHHDFGLEMALAADEIDDLVSQFRLRTSNRRLSHQQMQILFDGLPAITEADLTEDHKLDAVCPICYNTLVAILAEEETAKAMDSPTHPIEEMGVTKLQKTCGHLFCRKDIMKWISEGHDSCPSCRRPLLTDAERRENEPRPPAGDRFRPWRGLELATRSRLPNRPLNFSAALGVGPDGIGSQDRSNEGQNERYEFSGMYS
ncbi:hypothetical protein J3A83DRAFT_4370112 [Scleroderma citrinum]